jgi:hypothetical protein
MQRFRGLVAIAFVGGMAGPAGAVTLAPQDVFIHEIAWLEANQNAGPGEPLAGPRLRVALA